MEFRGRGRGGQQRGGDGGGEGLDQEEVAEDIYKGMGPDEAKPEQAEDWEHTEYNADDDMDQGEEDSLQRDADDPGQRKELGLEGEAEEGVDSAANEALMKLLGEE
ncbi:hypothetical protein HaLaN_21107, partial [Haematococcus lacustris]